MKKFILISLSVSLPIATYFVGLKVGDDMTYCNNVHVASIETKLKVAELEKNIDAIGRIAISNYNDITMMGNSIVPMSDAINILGDYYNRTSGNNLVNVIIDNEERIIVE